MNWNWLRILFGIRPKELPAPIHGESLPELPPAPLNDVFLEAIQESYDETYRLELELLNDAKLREYIKNTVKAMSRGLTKDSYDFILIHPSDAKINDKIWHPFAKIMIQLCAEIGIKAKDETSYLNVDKKQVREAFEKLKKQVIDIDERTRAMLSQGIYR
jgi:hypothetical protein